MTDRDGARPQHRPREWWRLAVAAAAVAVAVALAPVVVRSSGFVERVSVVNDGPYDVHVEVTGGDRKGWLSVTTAGSSATSVGRDVLDQGDLWIFRFRTQGRDGGELSITRTELRARGWSIEVPAAVNDRLRAAGAAPTPYGAPDGRPADDGGG